MDKAHRWTDRQVDKMGNHLATVYSKQQKAVVLALDGINGRFGDELDKLYAAIENAENDQQKARAKAEYLAFYRVRILRDKKVKALFAEIADELYRANAGFNDYINGFASAIYAENYNAISAEIAQQVDGFTVHKASEKVVEKVGAVEMHKRTLNKRKDTSWNKDNLQQSILTGAALGLAKKALTKRTAAVVVKKNINVSNTAILAVATGAENRGRLDAGERASDEGYPVKKQWIATLDNRTRPSHVRLDGEKVGVDGEFLPGLSYPRDPRADPEEVSGCRCSLKMDVGQRQGEERSAREGTVTGPYGLEESFAGTKTVRVSNMTYEEWAEWRKKQP